MSGGDGPLRAYLQAAVTSYAFIVVKGKTAPFFLKCVGRAVFPAFAAKLAEAWVLNRLLDKMFP